MHRIPANFLGIGLLCLYLLSGAQPSARLKFSTDTLAIGRPFEAMLTLNSKSKGQWVFPDSSNSFGSFELVSLERQGDTLSENEITLRYQFRSFDLRPNQSLRLQSLWIRGKDTLKVWSNADSVRIQSRIPVWHDTLPLLRYTNFYTIVPPTDYSLYLLILLSSILILTLLFLLLRKPVLKMRAKGRIRIRWQRMVHALEALPISEPDNFMYGLNHIFKTWLSDSDAHRYESMTTTEIREWEDAVLQENKELHTLLIQMSSTADRTVYGGDALASEAAEQLRKDTIRISEKIMKSRQEAVRV